MVESSRAKETEKRERRGGTSRAGLLPHLASLTTDVDGILSSPRADAALSGSCREHYRLIAIMHDEQLGRERDNAFRRRRRGGRGRRRRRSTYTAHEKYFLRVMIRVPRVSSDISRVTVLHL